jgi:hypothetical protein
LDPDEITSYEWFHYRWKRSSECIPVDVAAADIAIKKFCEHVRSGDIRLIGTQVYPDRLDRGWIRRTDSQIGELHVFGQALEVSKQGVVIRRYEEVTCSRVDVVRVVVSPSPSAPEARSETPPLPAAQPDEAVSGRPTASRRRRNQGGGTQTLRARAVLKRMCSQGYPTEEQESSVDLYERFGKEYEEYKKDEAKAGRHSRYPRPSMSVVMREVGRKTM